jgi:hypothetical protein
VHRRDDARPPDGRLDHRRPIDLVPNAAGGESRTAGPVPIRAGGRGLNWPDPDSLAGAVDPTRDQHEFEELGYLAPEVYEALTGEEMAPIERLGSTKPKGSRWEFDDGEQLARRLPRLARLYPD